jgi:hypothetical protein
LEVGVSIRAVIEELPDGWHYRWADIPENGGEAVEWANVLPTFEAAVEGLRESVRQRKPVGSLQNDEEVKEG